MAVQHITIEYSTDSGSTWYEITSSLVVEEGYGSYIWNVPETSSTQYLIRISTSSYSDISDDLFEVAQPVFISGTIYPASTENVEGITISFTNVLETFYTDASGYYTASILSASYTGTLTPSQTNFIFSPPSASITASGNTGSFDFISVFVPPPTTYYSISGSIFVSGTSIPMPSTQINIIINSIAQPPKYTDTNGIYSMSIASGSTFSLIPSYSHYLFEPVSTSYREITQSYSNQAFSASLITYTISGSIISSSGVLSGIEILCDYYPVSLFTDANGQFSRSYTESVSLILTPTSSEYTFNPGSIVYTLLSASQYNQDFFGTTIIPAFPGLGTYYDSRKAGGYNSTSNTLFDLSPVQTGQDIVTKNTYFDSNKNLLFGVDWLGSASASFVGTQVNPTFAIEFWIAPNTSSNSLTLLSTPAASSPQIQCSVDENRFRATYKESYISPSASKILDAYNINSKKYNYVVLFASASYLYLWSNGIFYASQSITQSLWNGAFIGNLPASADYFKGHINVIKIWNDAEINFDSVNQYYQNKNYWNNLQQADFSPPPGNPVIYTGFDSVNVYVIAASGPSSPPIGRGEAGIYEVIDSVNAYVIAASGPSSPPISGGEVGIYISSSII